MAPIVDRALLDYLRRVYRDPVLNTSDVIAALTPVAWLYNTAPATATCRGVKQDVFAQHRICGDNADVSVDIWEDAMHRQSSALPLNHYGRRVLAADSAACTIPGTYKIPFAPDGGWLEVIRVAVSRFDAEGGEAGCWFYAAAGSGIFLSVGRSLRAENRRALATELGLNVTMLNSRWPFHIDRTVNFCKHARSRGFDTIQIGSEWARVPTERQPEWAKFRSSMSAADVYEHEVISCRNECTTLATRRLNRACVKGLQTGIRHEKPCICKDRQVNSRTPVEVLNCLGTHPEVAPPWIANLNQTTPSCATLVRQRKLSQFLFRAGRAIGCNASSACV